MSIPPSLSGAAGEAEFHDRLSLEDLYRRYRGPVELRRDNALRAHVVQGDRSARQAISIGQRRALLLAMLVLCALGGGAARF